MTVQDRSVFNGRRSPQAQARVEESELGREVQVLELQKRKLVLLKEIQELTQEIKEMEAQDEIRT